MDHLGCLFFTEFKGNHPVGDAPWRQFKLKTDKSDIAIGKSQDPRFGESLQDTRSRSRICSELQREKALLSAHKFEEHQNNHSDTQLDDDTSKSSHRRKRSGAGRESSE